MANIEFKSFKLTFDTGDFILAYRKKQPSGFMGSFNIRYKINGDYIRQYPDILVAVN